MNSNITYFTLVLSTFFWGANFTFGKIALESMHPLSVAAWRFGIAAFCMFLILAFKKEFKFGVIKQNALIYFFMGLVGIAGFNALFFYGLRWTSSVNGALIMTLNPALTVSLSALVLRQRITSSQIFGLSLSLLGVLTVVTNASLSAFTSMSFSSGDILILAGNLCWACYSVMGKKFLKGSTPLQTSTFSMIIGAIFLALLAINQSDSSSFLAQPATVKGSILFMALLGSVLAYFWWNNAISKIGAAKTAVFFDLVPIWTVLLATYQGQKITIIQAIGASLVLVGVLFSSGIKLTRPKLRDTLA